MKKRKSPYLRSFGWGMFLAGALSLCSCSSDEMLDQQGQEQEVAIEFGKLKTRAAVNSATDIREFGVFADMNTIPNNDYISLLDYEKVTRVGTSNDFTYTNKRYWVNGHNFRFFAVFPHVEDKEYAAPYGTNYSTYVSEPVVTAEGYQISFVTPPSADIDFMTAYAERDLSKTLDYSAVNLNFAHALSKINIKVAKHSKNESNKVIVKSVKLIGVYDEGTYNTSMGEGNWSIDGSSTINIVNDFSDSNDPNIGLELISGGSETMGNGLLLIPQEFGNRHKVQVQIIYDFYMYDDESGTEGTESGTDTMKNQTVTATLPLDVDWVEGKHYTYNIVLQAVSNEIMFNKPMIKDWGKQTGATILIK